MPRRKDGPTLLDVTNKMRYAVTIMEGLEMRPHLRQCLLNKIALELHRAGQPMTVVKGTAVREVSERRLQAEQELLLGAKLDAPTDAARALSQLDATLKKEKARGKRTRDAQSLAIVNNVVDNIVALLHTLDMEEVPLPDGGSDADSDDGSTEGVDKVYSTSIRAPMTAEDRDLELLDWAGGMLNLRGRLPLSRNHFIALVAINGACLECIVDTGGARTMLDRGSAEAAGLKITPPGDGVEVGGYYGPSGGDIIPYAGIVAGPVQLRFSSDVVVTLGELKVLNASDPIVLVGADAMTAPLPAKKPGAGWQFLHIGYGRRDCGGIM